MQDRNQTGLAITRRGFVQSAIGSIIVLPAIGGVGIFSQRRVAHAAVGIDEMTGASFTNEGYVEKITVIDHTEMSIVVVDSAIGPRAFVPGAKVKLTSRYCKDNPRYENDTVEGVTDEEGKVIFSIKHLSENPNYLPLDKLPEYEFNGTIEITCDGYRTFKTALIRIHGGDILVTPTRGIQPGDPAAYPHMMSFNEWDVLYFENEFLTSSENKEDQTFFVEGRNFGSEECTVILREQGTQTEVMSTKATPQGGTLKASMKHKFSLLGGDKSLEVDKSYELAVLQGALTYVWPLQLRMKKGVLPKPLDDTVDFNPFNTALTSKTGLVIKWPSGIPVVGGTTTNVLDIFNCNTNVYFDPFGYAQLTATIPIYGYKRDNGESDEQGWAQYPLKSASDQYKKWENDTADMWKKAKDTFSKKGVFKQTEFFAGISFQIYFQVVAALKWNDEKHVFRGEIALQLCCSLDFTLSEQFFIGPVPVVIVFTFNITAVLAMLMGMHTEPEDPGKDLFKQLLDFSCWTVAPSDAGVTLTLNLTPTLSVGIGVRGVLSASVRGKITLTVSVIIPQGVERDAPGLKDKPIPHFIAAWSAAVDVVLQALFYTKSIPLWKQDYKEIKNNWKGLEPQAIDDLVAMASGDESLAEFMGSMKPVTPAMLQGSIESTGLASQSINAQSVDDELTTQGIFNWSLVRGEDVSTTLHGQTMKYAVYHFPGRKKAFEGIDTGSTSGQTQGMPAKDAKSGGSTGLRAGELAPAGVPGASRWHRGTSVRFDDKRVLCFGASSDGLTTQAEGSVGLPQPEVEEVRPTGGVRPKSDVIISTDGDGDRLIYGDPHIKVLDIQTNVTNGGESVGLRATCSFRIGVVQLSDQGPIRSRIIMTVLDASIESFVGMQRVIEFDIDDVAGITHDDLYDYEFGLAFSSYEKSAGGYEGSVDQVEIVIVSGKRAAGEGDTNIAAAASDLYLTYLSFYAQEFLTEDLANLDYFQLTLPANRITNPDGDPSDLLHYISNINCVTKVGSDGSSLLVAYLDRAAESQAKIFSDNDADVTVCPRFLFFTGDYGYVDVMIPDSTALDNLLNRLTRNNASVLRFTLSPEIGGLHTLAMQAQHSTYFYVLGFTEDSTGFTVAAECPMLDAGLSLVPWPEQDCFLTSFANEEYRATPEFLNGSPETWDRSKWVLQKAWWEPTGAGTYILHFEAIGPDNFNFSRFALSNSGTFIFWPEGRTGSDEYLYDEDGNYTVSGEDESVFQVKACRVRNNTTNNKLHFSDPFVIADVKHAMDQLEPVATHDRYAPFEILSTEYVDTSDRMDDGETPLYHSAHLWYTAVPNLRCATVIASSCTLPVVTAGGTALFDVCIRNDGNSFLSGCTLQMYEHKLTVDENGNPIVDAEGRYIDEQAVAVGSSFELQFNAETLQPSSLDKTNADGEFIEQEPDFALPPGKRSLYRVEVPIPSDWHDVKWVSFHASNPTVAEGGSLSAQSVDGGLTTQAAEDGIVEFSVEPGTYPVVSNRTNLEQSKHQHFMTTLSVQTADSSIYSYADSPVTVYETGTQPTPSPTSTDKNTAARGAAAKTGDPVPLGLLAGLGAAGAAMAAYSKRRLENEREAQSEGSGQGDGE